MRVHTEIHEWRDLPHQKRAEEIVIRFHVAYEGEKRHSVMSVTPEIYRAAVPGDIIVLEPLRFGHETPFRARFGGERRVHGWLRWGSGLAVDQSNQITGRIEIAEADDFDFWTYLGFMVSFGSRRLEPRPPHPGPLPPPTPLPGPLPIPDPADGLAVAETSLDAGELFPFVYLTPWPKLRPERLAHGFMTVPAAVQAGAFYSALKAAQPPARMQIAVDAIDAAPDPPTPGHFLPPHARLTPPFDTFTHFPHELRAHCTRDALDAWVNTKCDGWQNLAAELQTADSITARTDIWNTVIALLIVSGYDHGWLADLIQLLQVTHLVDAVIAAGDAATHQSDALLGRLLTAVLVLPGDIFPISPPPVTTPPTVTPYAVGAVRTVHYRPGRYLLGDIERIETVMAGETREEGHRDLRRVEEMAGEDDLTESTGHTARDTATADLIAEVQKTLLARTSATSVKDYKADYGPPGSNTMTVTGDWNVVDNPAGGTSRDISKFARDVVERTVKVMHRQALARRRTMSLEETEHTRRRTLSNREGGSNRQAVYRWVNRAYHLETRSAPDRLVLEITTTRPGRHLVEALSRFRALVLAPPESPGALGVNKYKDVLPEPVSVATPDPGVYYLDVFAAYDIPPDPPPPAAQRTLAVAVRSCTPLADVEVEVPDGYSPKTVTACITPCSSTIKPSVSIAGMALKAGSDPMTFTGDLSGTPAIHARHLPVTVLCEPQSSTPPSEFETLFSATVEIECCRNEATLATWQMTAFLKIRAAYEVQRKAFDAAMTARRRDLGTDNPLLLRQIVREQLVQAGVSEFAMASRGRADAGPPEQPHDEPRYVRFLRDALDWEGMSVELQGGIGKDPSWNEGETALIDLYAPALSLVDFLKAARARLLVPARSEAARPLLLALRTGTIWPCEPDLAPCVAPDMAIVDQLLTSAHERGFSTEDRWSIVVPTSMTAFADDDPFHGKE